MQDMMAKCRDMVCVDNDVDITPVDDSPKDYTLRLGIPAAPISLGFIPLYNVKHCGARGS